jgi:deoxyribodipyrimidine photo-lyase
MKKIWAHWFRRDLRLADHPIWAELHEGRQPHPEIAVVFEPLTSFGPVRNFWRESVEDLQRRTPQIRWFLLNGDPVSAWHSLASEFSITRISTAKSWNFEEEILLSSVRDALPQVEWSLFRDQCLHDPEQIKRSQIRGFTPFYHELRKKPLLGHQLSASLSSQATVSSGPVASEFRGGELAGLAQLFSYLRHPEGVLRYHERRNGMLEFLDSSKLSPWLSWGCLSPLRVAQELSGYLKEEPDAEGPQKLLYELYWREFFKHTSLALGPALFSVSGVRGREPQISAGQEVFERWKLGLSGQPFNDANMRELLQTGWMSNRGRQNVASFWTKTLQGDWRWGARWFSEQLVDYDPESNFGNWQYLAGVGYDSRDRVFNLDRQADLYDPTGAYQRRWLGK